METAAYIFSGVCALFALMKAYYGANRQYYKELSLKTMASLAFIAVGIFSLLSNESAIGVYGLFILVGGVLGLVGDLFLGVDSLFKDTKEASFVHAWGVVCFLLGHVAYSIAMLTRFEFKLWLIPVVFIMPLCYVVAGLTKTKIFQNKFNGIFMTVYFAALGLGVTAGINAVIVSSGSAVSIMLLVAAVLFVVSDCVLGFTAFSNKRVIPTSVKAWVVPITYYAAQLLYMTTMILL